MYKVLHPIVVAIFILIISTFANAKPSKSMHGYAKANYISFQQKAPLLFTQNLGQVADAAGHSRPDVLYTAGDNNMKLFLSGNAISYQLTKSPGKTKKNDVTNAATSTARFNIALVGSNIHPVIRKEEGNTLVENFYLPQCPQGITNVPTYGRLVYENVYPGVDWIIYSKGQRIEYDFLVKAGIDASSIRMKITGAGLVKIATDGSLIIKTALGEVRQQAPKSSVNEHSVPSRFCWFKDGSIGFKVNNRDINKPLIIDPSVKWGTYYGGTGSEMGNAIIVSGRYVYLTGRTGSSTNIANTGFQNTFGGGAADAMIVKFDTAGNRYWATYYGGASTSDFGYNSVVDSAGNVYFVGLLQSAGLASAGAYQTTMAGVVDAIIVKFNSSGARVWATYFGGSGNDQGYSCAIHGKKLYIAGQTNSSVGIASSGAFQTTIGSSATYDAFLAQFDTTGRHIWSTYYGGSGAEGSISTAVDDSGYVYLSGFTQSASGIASVGAFQSSLGGGYDLFLAKFDSLGHRKWGTYYGGAGNDLPGLGSGMKVSGNDIYIAGQTASSSLFSTSGSYQTLLGGAIDAFLGRFNTSGQMIWCTYYGGTGNDFGSGCALDSYGGVYLAGYTASPVSIATTTGFQYTFEGGYDGFLAKFDTSGTRVWGSYYGGNDTDYILSCSADGTGHVYLAGYTNSASGISTTGAYQAINAGDYDAFITKISDPLIYSDTAYPASLCAGSILSIPFIVVGSFNSDNIFTAQLSDVTGSFGSPVNIGTHSGTLSGTIPATIPAGTEGGTAYKVRVMSSDPVAANMANSLTINIQPLPVTPAIVGNSSVCSGLSYVYNVSGAVGTTDYTWILPSGWTGSSTTDTLYAVSGSAGGTFSVTGSNSCGTTTPETLAVIVSPLAVPSATIIVSPGTTVIPGQIVTFTADVVNGGATPIYQWLLNDMDIAGANSSSYSTTTLLNGDVISLWLQSDTCAMPDTTSSNAIVMSVTEGVAQYTNSNSPAIVYPNPNNGSFTISSDHHIIPGEKLYIEVSNQLGQIIDKEVITAYSNNYTQKIKLSDDVKNGIYIMKIWSNAKTTVVPIIINK